MEGTSYIKREKRSKERGEKIRTLANPYDQKREAPVSEGEKRKKKTPGLRNRRKKNRA